MRALASSFARPPSAVSLAMVWRTVASIAATWLASARCFSRANVSRRACDARASGAAKDAACTSSSMPSVESVTSTARQRSVHRCASSSGSRRATSRRRLPVSNGCASECTNCNSSPGRITVGGGDSWKTSPRRVCTTVVAGSQRTVRAAAPVSARVRTPTSLPRHTCPAVTRIACARMPTISAALPVSSTLAVLSAIRDAGPAVSSRRTTVPTVRAAVSASRLPDATIALAIAAARFGGAHMHLCMVCMHGRACSCSRSAARTTASSPSRNTCCAEAEPASERTPADGARHSRRPHRCVYSP